MHIWSHMHGVYLVSCIFIRILPIAISWYNLRLRCEGLQRWPNPLTSLVIYLSMFLCLYTHLLSWVILTPKGLYEWYMFQIFVVSVLWKPCIFPPKPQKTPKPKNVFSRQNREITFSAKPGKTHFPPKPQKKYFPPETQKMHFSRQKRQKCTFSAKTAKYIFPLKSRKKKNSRQTRKTHFFVKNTFSAKTAKRTFTAKLQKCIFRQTHKNVFSAKTVIMLFFRRNKKKYILIILLTSLLDAWTKWKNEQHRDEASG